MCISGCHFREVQNVRSFGTEGRTDGARGFASQIRNLPRLILMIGLADMNEPCDVDWGEPQDVLIVKRSDLNGLTWIHYRTIVSNFMFSSIPTKAKSLLAFGLLDLQISSPWARQHEVPQSNEIYDFIIFRGKGGDMSRQK